MLIEEHPNDCLKNCKVIAEKSSDNIECTVFIKNFNKLIIIEGNFLSLWGLSLKNPQLRSELVVKDWMLHLRSGTRQ